MRIAPFSRRRNQRKKKTHDLHHSISIAEHFQFQLDLARSLALPLMAKTCLVNDINAICSLIKYFTSQTYRHIAQNDLQCCIDYLLIQRCESFVYA